MRRIKEFGIIAGSRGQATGRWLGGEASNYIKRSNTKEIKMRYIIGWLLGVPISLLVIIWLVSHF